MQLDDWIIMPNHMHGIIRITEMGTPRRGAGNAYPLSDVIDAPHVVRKLSVGTPRRGVPTMSDASPDASDISMDGIAPHAAGRNAHPSWKPGCLGSIINQFKTVCTKRIRAAGFVDFA
ncbi:hypothetical protein EXS70_01880 [Candidatus Peribacteria bacterium]|nr:hypothetical protein [Candidatus Peribacteria bacterium]